MSLVNVTESLLVIAVVFLARVLISSVPGVVSPLSGLVFTVVWAALIELTPVRMACDSGALWQHGCAWRRRCIARRRVRGLGGWGENDGRRVGVRLNTATGMLVVMVAAVVAVAVVTVIVGTMLSVGVVPA